MTAVPRIWDGGTVVLLGTGPSLCADDVNYVRSKARVIAINSAVDLCPWADCLLAADFQWWRWTQGAPQFAGLKFASDATEPRFWAKAPWGSSVQRIHCRPASNFETDPTRLGCPSTGHSSSGYLAINLAVHLGASRILLLGYDLMRGKQGAHFFGNYPSCVPPPLGDMLKAFRHLVDPLKRLGIPVINCSRQTALTVFPRQSLELALC